MTHIIDARPRRRLSLKLTAGLAISALALLALGSLAAPADAARRGEEHRGSGWGGGYRAPPVVFGSSYGPGYYGAPYYAPPVVYVPGVFGVW
jgi:hypothetical protein